MNFFAGRFMKGFLDWDCSVLFNENDLSTVIVLFAHPDLITFP